MFGVGNSLDYLSVVTLPHNVQKIAFKGEVEAQITSPGFNFMGCQIMGNGPSS